MMDKMWNKRPDLRRDCDLGIVSIVATTMKQTTWFTKGLRRRGRIVFTSTFKGNKRPDLRRDCDFSVFILFSPSYWKQTTWFTKGLRQQADLPLPVGRLAMKQTTWFTKGLRPAIFFTCLDNSGKAENFFMRKLTTMPTKLAAEIGRVLQPALAAAVGLHILIRFSDPRCRHAQVKFFDVRIIG